MNDESQPPAYTTSDPIPREPPLYTSLDERTSPESIPEEQPRPQYRTLTPPTLPTGRVLTPLELRQMLREIEEQIYIETLSTRPNRSPGLPLFLRNKIDKLFKEFKREILSEIRSSYV